MKWGTAGARGCHSPCSANPSLAPLWPPEEGLPPLPALLFGSWAQAGAFWPEKHQPLEPQSLPASLDPVMGLAPPCSPICSGREMCILQLVLTTARAPDSRAETMGPSAGSFSTRSLTSCVPKSGDRVGMALPLPCMRWDRDPGTLQPS